MPTVPRATGDLVIRDLHPADAEAVRTLVLAGIGSSPYAASASSAIETAIAASDPDARATVAVKRDQPIALVLFGAIAGAVGSGRVQLVITASDHRRRGVATRLVETAVSRMTADGARTVFVELPDDPDLAPAKHLLLRCGFHIGATVADYFRDGVGLSILRRDLSTRDQVDHGTLIG